MIRILVVGCGPTGLTLAGVLKTQGVDVTLIDRYPGVLKATKAAAIHARALEVLDTLSIADRIVEEGQKVEYLNLRTRHEDRLIIRFNELADTEYPFMIDLPQYRTEEILIERLGQLGLEPRRSVALTKLEQRTSGVTVTLEPRAEDGKTPAGPGEVHEFDYVVGCDGVRSTVRDLIGLGFGGETYADPWCLTDAEVDWPIPRNEMTFSSDETGICGMFPLPQPGRFRVVYTQWMDEAGKPIPPDRENMLRAIERTGHRPLVGEIGKFWTFDLDHRQVERYRVGRVFLCGDAAHVHTPFGGQGMNLGIADAQNLAWKLAAVAKGEAGDALLESYNDERHPIAAEVIRLTHLGASAMLVRSGPKAALRDLAFELLDRPEHLKQRISHRLSQLSHGYRTHHLLGPAVGEGDRLPNRLFHDGYTSRKHRLHDRVRPGRLNLVYPASGTHEAALNGVGDVLAEVKARSPVPLTISVYSRFPVADREAAAAVDDFGFDRKAELDPAIVYDARAFLVRPDGFVGPRHLEPMPVVLLEAIDHTYARTRTERSS